MCLLRAAASLDPLVPYRDLICRRYRGDALVEEAVSRIAMPWWNLNELERRIGQEGVRVLQRWGGYAGDAYGTGPGLIIAFTCA